MTPREFFYPRVALDFYQSMTTRGVPSPTLIHFTIDGRHGILEARDIVETLQIPFEPVDPSAFHHWSQYLRGTWSAFYPRGLYRFDPSSKEASTWDAPRRCGAMITTQKLFDHQSNMRLRRVIWNPWKINGKLRNMKNKSFEVLCHKQIRNARRGSKEKSAMKQFFMSVMSATFGALPEVQFMHDILFQRLGSHQSNSSNGAKFGAEIKELQLLEAEHRKLKANFAALRNQPFAAK
ncbi:hypothetical protein CK203_107268 [Vitis vinifera]|uniref:Uncharacterized protein n=1 Tax=Vitis vinifera TaxID=29760 RepID=A0A438DLE0_VITVI|nr:hypothetical protein CK203_107268 [Vitis vinifera]